MARGIAVDGVKHAGIVESAAGKVRTLKRDEIDADWDPTADGHLTVWSYGRFRCDAVRWSRPSLFGLIDARLRYNPR